MADDADTRPTPDPTVLTTEALERAMAAMRDYVDGQLDVLRERFRGIDRATEVLNETITRVPTDVQKEVGHLRELMQERSEAVTERFGALERARLEQKTDTGKAVEAALAAAKELSAALGASFAKQLDQLTITFQTADASRSTELSDAKSRLDRLEAGKIGGQENKTGIYMAIIALGATMTIIVIVANALFK